MELKEFQGNLAEEFSNANVEKQKKSRDEHLNPEEGKEDAEKLLTILSNHSHKRALILGPPCSGKSTLLQHIPSGIDMDIVFDDMSKKDKQYLLHHENPMMFIDGDRETIKFTEKKFNIKDDDNIEYLRKTTESLTSYINQHVQVKQGHPVFGSVVIDADVIVYLNIEDELLESRIQNRSENTHRVLQKDRVFAVRTFLENDIHRMIGVRSCFLHSAQN